MRSLKLRSFWGVGQLKNDLMDISVSGRTPGNSIVDLTKHIDLLVKVNLRIIVNISDICQNGFAGLSYLR